MPPWRIRTCPSRRQASGIQSNTLATVVKTELPGSCPRRSTQALQKPAGPMKRFISMSSWLPRTSTIRSGYTTFSAKSSTTTSSWCAPRSTQSPLKTYVVPCWSSEKPKSCSSSSTSRNWPWMSPKILAGARASTSTQSEARRLSAALDSAATICACSCGLDSSSSIASGSAPLGPAQCLSMTSFGSSLTSFIISLAWSTIWRARSTAGGGTSKLPKSQPRIAATSRLSGSAVSVRSSVLARRSDWSLVS
mmetsp:Transcript_78506/g.206038  ORF Transcript_78506/g.206038 Transcript_78506/m.206038 type:complete len:250 (+) Transcript_78506:527-1276(+)